MDAGGARLAVWAIFVRIWPGVRMVLAALVVGGVVLAGARAAGYAITTWWEALLWIGGGVIVAADPVSHTRGRTRRY